MLRTLVLGTAVAVGLMLAGQGTAQAGGPGHHGGHHGGGYGGHYSGHHHHHHHGYGYGGGYVGRPVGYRPVFVGNAGPAWGSPYGYGYGQPACGTGYGGYGYGYRSGFGIATPSFGLYYSR